MPFKYDLRPVKTKEQLLVYIGVPELLFDWVVNYELLKDSFDDFVDEGNRIEAYSLAPYIQHKIPKRNRNRGVRIVWEANPALADCYKGLARRLVIYFESSIDNFPHPKCFGYVRGRSIRDNAFLHIGSAKIAKLDLASFFPTITSLRIINFLIDSGVCTEVATLLTRFITIGGKLPLGLATSPVIANAICHELDDALERFSNANSCKYSRYADDLTFSFEKSFFDIEPVQEIIESFGFSLADGKTKFSKRGQNHYVTGLSISDPNRPRAPRSMKRRLRQKLYYAEKYGLREHLTQSESIETTEQSAINRIDGLVKYVSFHEPNLARVFIPKWRFILEQSGATPSFAPKNYGKDAFDIFVDETEFTLNGIKYLALAMSASQHQHEINKSTQKTLDSFLAYPWADGNIEKLKQNGLHYADATEDLRGSYVRELQKLPFKGYISFGKLDNDYQATYLRLLKHIIRRRLIASESRLARFCFEENSKVSLKSLKNLIDESVSDLVKHSNHRPNMYTVHQVGKEMLGVSVPDFILGVFRRYVMSGQEKDPPQREHNMFEALRDKVRVISNADTGEDFTRRNPFDNMAINDE